MIATAALPVPRTSIGRLHAGSWAVSTSVLLVAALSPFERPLNGLAVGGFTVTTLEAALLIAFALGAAAFASDLRSLQLRTPITLPIAILLSVVLIAALAAPEFRGNALRFWGRLIAAALLLLLTLNVLATRRLAAQLIAVLLASGSIVGVLAILELAQVPWVMETLRVFRPGFHVVGGQVRATSTLLYPTITSMYLEVVFALGLSRLLSSDVAPGSGRTIWAFAALTLVGAGIIATFTRAGLITIALSLAIVGLMRFFRSRRWNADHSRLAALAAVLVILVVVSRSPQMLVTRMSTEGSQDWYGAAYTVPQTLTLAPGSFNDVPVTLSNRGLIAWQSQQSPAFALSYHWLSIDAEEIVIYDGLRTPFVRPVEPGEDVRVQARVRAPGYPGTYLLVWDVVQEHRTWLSLEGVYPGRTITKVEGEAVTTPLATHGPMPTGVMRLPRRLLWTTALEIARDRPLLGVGPDNFRNVYGRYLGLITWDTRVHSNNMYLEALADLGIVGLGAVLWLVFVLFRVIWQRWSDTTDASLPLVAAVAAACVAIAVHGLVDSFVAFTPTYVVFALTAGLLLSPAAVDSAGKDQPPPGLPQFAEALREGGRQSLRASPYHAHRI